MAAFCDTAMARGYRHSSRGRRGGGGFGGSAASSAAMGYAQILAAQSRANLTNSQAAMNWEKAKTQEIQNRLLWTETYFKMRQVNHDMRLAEQGPRMTAQQAIALAHDALPRRLDSVELDPVTGRISYPEVLRDPQYDSLRSDVDHFFKNRAAVNGSIDYYDLQHIDTILNLFHNELQHNMAEYKAGVYGHAVTFLESLGYESRAPVQ